MGHNDQVDSQIERSEAARALLLRLRDRTTVAELAHQIGRSEKTINRWIQGTTECPPFLVSALEQLVRSRPDGKEVSGAAFTMIDLFAGIGGIRRGFEAVGGECVFTSEWNAFSKRTYLENYGESHPIVGDITRIDEKEVPDHDVLLAGFPCQPFSLAGVSKKNSMGRLHGFDDPTQGTLFFDLKRILREKRPSAFMLENVKNLQSHDGKRTFEVIRATLEDELQYELHIKVIDGQSFTPQHRERIILVGFNGATDFAWDDFTTPTVKPKLRSILHRTDGSEPLLPWDGERFFDHEQNQVPSKYTLTTGLWTYLQAYAAKHRAAGNGFGFGLADVDGVSRTLSARYHKDGAEILIPQRGDLPPRRLTPRECARLMGYPDTFRIPVSDTQAYKQFGNSVVVPVISEVARIMAPRISEISPSQPLVA